MPVEVNSPFWPLGAGKATWAGVKAKQLEFRLLVRSLSDRGRPGKNGLLGAKPDTKLAVQLNRTRLDVYWHRMKLGIRPAVERPMCSIWLGSSRRVEELLASRAALLAAFSGKAGQGRDETP